MVASAAKGAGGRGAAAVNLFSMAVAWFPDTPTVLPTSPHANHQAQLFHSPILDRHYRGAEHCFPSLESLLPDGSPAPVWVARLWKETFAWPVVSDGIVLSCIAGNGRDLDGNHDPARDFCDLHLKTAATGYPLHAWSMADAGAAGGR